MAIIKAENKAKVEQKEGTLILDEEDKKYLEQIQNQQNTNQTQQETKIDITENILSDR